MMRMPELPMTMSSNVRSRILIVKNTIFAIVNQLYFPSKIFAE